MSTDRIRGVAAFTLIELLASLAILALIMTMLFTVFEQVNKAWLNGENRVETFTQARAILDLMSRDLSQAIATSKIPFYGNTNEVGFVAPVNTDANQADLCEVDYKFDNSNPNKLTLTRHLTESTDANWDFYANAGGWWTTVDATKDAILANDTILNLTFQYLKIDGTAYLPAPPYQSQNNGNKLPYAVVISMDAVDSRTATRLKLVPNVGTAWQPITNSTLRRFSTTVYLPNISPP